MKRAVAIVLLFSAIFMLCAAKKAPAYREARRNGASVKIELHVKDDDGTPVEKAEVKAFLGMNFRQLGKWVEGETNTNGVFVIEGKTCGDEIEVSLSKLGYYDSTAKYCYITMGAERDVKDGKWQPYGETVPLVLRKIKAPAKLSIMQERRFRNTKCINQWIGYDLEKFDFVEPHGTGCETDFEVFIGWDGKWLPEYSGMEVLVRFPSLYSGYCPVDVVSESAFKGPYAVQTRIKYSKDAVIYERITKEGCVESAKFDPEKCWVVRTRCKVDDTGKLISANYATIFGIESSCEPDGIAGVCVIGVFNPTPNDTNLEPKIDHAR